MLIPTFSKGTPEIPAEVYEKMRKQFQAELASGEGYVAAAFAQGSTEMKKEEQEDDK